MNKKILLAGFLVSIMLFVPINSAYSNIGIQIDNKTMIISSNSGNIFYVGGNGSGNYSKIQDAIDDASDGDIVFVYDDSSPYYEWDILINKPINLIGENRNTTTIDGDFKGSVIKIQSDNVKISGLTIKNVIHHYTSDWEYNVIQGENCSNLIIVDNKLSVGLQEVNRETAGVYLKTSSNNLIKNNLIFENDYSGADGVVIAGNSYNNNISRNEFFMNSDGIQVGGYDNIVFNNDIYDNIWGIKSNGNSNNILNNKIDTGGIEIYGDSNNILNNKINIIYNTVFIGGDNNLLSGNIITNISGAFYGIVLRHAKNNIIYCNQIENFSPGLWIDTSGGNIFKMNNFINSEIDAGFYDYNIPEPNNFLWNYWSSHPSRLPKIMINIGNLRISYFFIPVPYIHIDWHPVTKPYDITNPQSYDI